MARLIAPFDSLPTVGKPSHAQHTAQPRQNPPAPKVPTDIEQWLNEHLKQIPKTLHRHARNRFLKTADAQEKGWGWYHAKNELTATIERMTTHTPPAALAVGIDAQDERIKTFSEMYASASAQQIRERNAGITYAEERLGHSIQGETLDSQLARIQDPAYWRREIRKALRPWRELWHLALAPHYIKYASAEAVAEYRSMQENGRIWAETHEMTTTEGKTCPLPTPAETAKNRYAQLVAMTKGIETLAGEAGMTAHILTISLDSQYHPAKDAYKKGPRIRNEKYDPDLTPREGQAFLNRRWRLFRTALSDAEIPTFWVLGVQPNRDETPHWHVVLWCKEEDKELTESRLYKYFKTNDRMEKKGDGTVRSVQVDWQEAKSEAGSSSYAMRMLAYITRQTAEQRDNTTADEAEAEAASAWASTWGIRRYRTSHTAATLWKMTRHQEIKAPADLKESAQTGDFATFYKLKQQYACKILYNQRVGKYGDTYKSPRGIEYTHTDTGEIGASWKQTNWTLSVKLEKQQENQAFYSYFKEPRQGASAPQVDPNPPNSDPPPHWGPREKAEWAEFLEYRITQQVAKLAKTA